LVRALLGFSLSANRLLEANARASLSRPTTRAEEVGGLVSEDDAFLFSLRNVWILTANSIICGRII
jgi:hypothetical protein